jgi:hypothetical protein
LRLVLLFEVLGSLGLGRIELAEVSFVVVKSLTVLMDNILGDVVKEGSVVGSEMYGR